MTEYDKNKDNKSLQKETQEISKGSDWNMNEFR